MTVTFDDDPEIVVGGDDLPDPSPPPPVAVAVATPIGGNNNNTTTTSSQQATISLLGVYTHQKGIFFLLAGISAIPIPRRHMAVNIVAREQGYKDM